jgi:hypothetical protein
MTDIGFSGPAGQTRPVGPRSLTSELRRKGRLRPFPHQQPAGWLGADSEIGNFEGLMTNSSLARFFAALRMTIVGAVIVGAGSGRGQVRVFGPVVRHDLFVT